MVSSSPRLVKASSFCVIRGEEAGAATPITFEKRSACCESSFICSWQIFRGDLKHAGPSTRTQDLTEWKMCFCMVVMAKTLKVRKEVQLKADTNFPSEAKILGYSKPIERAEKRASDGPKAGFAMWILRGRWLFIPP